MGNAVKALRAASMVTAVVVASLLSGCGSSSTSVGSPIHGLESWPTVQLDRISCPKAGGCVASGTKVRAVCTGGRCDTQWTPDVVVEQHGMTWSRPIPIGTAGDASNLDYLACSPTGDCVYSANQADFNARTGLPRFIAFARSHGRWGGVHTVTLVDPESNLETIASACSSNGDCWLITYRYGVRVGNDPNVEQAYAIGEANGRWFPAFRLGGPDFQTSGHQKGVVVSGISYWSASACTVFGDESSTAVFKGHPFTQTEVGGSWGPSLPTPAADEGGPAASFELGETPSSTTACSSRDTCLLGGLTGPSGSGPGAVEQEIGGKWAPVRSAIGRALGSKLEVIQYQTSCHGSAICVAVGLAARTPTSWGVFMVAEVRGRWLRPLLVSSDGDLQSFTQPRAVACPTATTCDVVGQNLTASGQYLSFEASYAGSKWHYSTVGLGGTSTLLRDMSCSGSDCWVVGDVYGLGSHDAVDAVVFPFSSVKLAPVH